MRYRKRPIEVEARRVGGDDSYKSLAAWCGGCIVRASEGRKNIGIGVKTSSGTMLAGIGDYIVKGVDGEFRPFKPGVFAATYEPVEDGDETSCT